MPAYYLVAPPEWQVGHDLEPDGEIRLLDLEEAVERAGEYGGLVLELRLEEDQVTQDWSGRPHISTTVPARRIRVLGG